MRYKEVHGNVFTVHKLVHCVPHLVGHPVCVEVGVVLEREEGRVCVCVYRKRKRREGEII